DVRGPVGAQDDGPRAEERRPRVPRHAAARARPVRAGARVPRHRRTRRAPSSLRLVSPHARRHRILGRAHRRGRELRRRVRRHGGRRHGADLASSQRRPLARALPVGLVPGRVRRSRAIPAASRAAPDRARCRVVSALRCVLRRADAGLRILQLTARWVLLHERRHRSPVFPSRRGLTDRFLFGANVRPGSARDKVRSRTFARGDPWTACAVRQVRFSTMSDRKKRRSAATLGPSRPSPSGRIAAVMDRGGDVERDGNDAEPTTVRPRSLTPPPVVRLTTPAAGSGPLSLFDEEFLLAVEEASGFGPLPEPPSVASPLLPPPPGYAEAVPPAHSEPMRTWADADDGPDEGASHVSAETGSWDTSAEEVARTSRMPDEAASSEPTGASMETSPGMPVAPTEAVGATSPLEVAPAGATLPLEVAPAEAVRATSTEATAGSGGTPAEGAATERVDEAAGTTADAAAPVRLPKRRTTRRLVAPTAVLGKDRKSTRLNSSHVK